MPTPPANTFTDIWSEPAPIRAPRQEKKEENRVLKLPYQKHLFRCPRNTTKWIRILPNTRQSQHSGQWILSHRIVYIGDVRIIDPEFYTKRTSPFSMFHSRLRRAEPELARLLRTPANPEGISTWPKDYGVARVIEIPTSQDEPSRISILHASMNDGTNGLVGYLYNIAEMAQAINNDPGLPKELRGTPKYKFPIVDPQHGRLIGLTRTNTYTPTIGDAEDYLTLIQRFQSLAEHDPDGVAMATTLGLENLLYESTDEEAHQLLEATYPRVYPHLFPERVTHQSAGIPSERRNGGQLPPNPLAEAVRKVQEQNGTARAPSTYKPENDLNGMNDQDDRFPELSSKAPKAELTETDEDAILDQLLGANNGKTNGNRHDAPKPYENKVQMAGDFQKLSQLSPGNPEYVTIKGRLKASLSLLSQLTAAQIEALKKIVGEEKFSDVTTASEPE
jgi:hypothetical protein